MPNRLDLFLNMLLAEVLLCDVFYFALFCFTYNFFYSFIIYDCCPDKSQNKT